MAVTLELQFANQGWHVRWHTQSTQEFQATRAAFKDAISLHDRYWDPNAFDTKGGWWVRFGALEEAAYLFTNFQAVRDKLYQEYWPRYERERKEAYERFVREQQKESQARAQKAERQQQKRRAPGGQRQQKKARAERPQTESQQGQPPKRENVKLPQTTAEALALLHLSFPVTAKDIQRAYREQARKCHPDRGGSHAAMVLINAAYELALKAC